MADFPNLDFETYVRERRQAQRDAADSDGTADEVDAAHAYAYGSDRRTRAAFARAKPVELAVQSSVRLFKQAWKNQLLGQAVRVSGRQFGSLFAIAKRCAGELQIPTPDVYVVNSPTLNAATYGTEDESFIVVHSALIDHYSDEELAAVIGHECGHIHNGHVVYITALHYLTHMAGVFVRWIVQPALVALRSWSRRAEITCDRAAMLCTKDLALSERAIAKLAIGSKRLYDEFDLEAFLAQHDEGSKGVGRYMEVFASHPWLPKRVLAMREFAKTELYRRAAGLGEGGTTMQEADEKVRALLKGEAR